jgi:hypothetical protein
LGIPGSLVFSVDRGVRAAKHFHVSSRPIIVKIIKTAHARTGLPGDILFLCSCVLLPGLGRLLLDLTRLEGGPSLGGLFTNATHVDDRMYVAVSRER